MICVECAAPVRSSYVYYSADNIHTVKCTQCGQFADKYIECDMILIFIDLSLSRPEAIRHVVFNAMADEIGEQASGSRAGTPVPSNKSYEGVSSPLSQHRRVFGIQPTVVRSLIFVTMLDVFIQWARTEQSTVPYVLRFLVFTPVVVQYLMFMALCVCDTIFVHVLMRTLARHFLGWQDASAVSISLLIGSFFKLSPISTFIWHYDIPFVEHVVRYASSFCMTEILAVTLNKGYLVAGSMTLAARSVSFILAKIFWTSAYMITI